MITNVSDNAERPVYLGLVWDRRDAEKAKLKHTFIRVSQSNKRSERKISGAERLWSNKETEDEIYLVNYRISGKPKDVAIALNTAGYTEEQVEEAMVTALSKDTYQTSNKEIYDEELQQLKKFLEEEHVRQKQEQVDWPTLFKIAQDIKHANIIIRETPRVGIGRRSTLLEKYKDVQSKEGKVVDVSKMTKDGTPVTVKNKPTSERSRSVFIDAVPVISSNEKSFLRALEMLYNAGEFESEKEYRKTANLVQAKFNKKRR